MSRERERGRSRRSVLLSGAALAATSGCVRRTRNVMARDPASQVSLRILTVPADTSPFPNTIARELASNLQACGVDATLSPMSPEALHRRVLLDNDFDIYVGRFHRPDWIEPDRLYSLLHSSFASEPGWQNPFGYTDIGLDEHLDAQRTTTGVDRRAAVETVQTTITETQPFTTLAFPDALSTVRTDRFEGWLGDPSDPLTLLGLTPRSESATTLRLATTDGRATENRNPLAVEFRTHGALVDLLYDPLGRRVDTVLDPWLAADWQFSTDDTTEAVVTLREGCRWHDGEPVTAEDVAFTYRLLDDTSLGSAESPIPASRYRGQSSLVDDVEAVDDLTVRMAFGDASPVVAERAFAVPVLPEHVWRDRAEPATVAGVETNRTMTEALVWNNPEPVGSGPLQFERAVPGDSLRLSRFDDHFLREEPADLPDRLAGGPGYEELRLAGVGSDDAAVELVAAGDADATAAPLGTGVVPRIGREPALDLVSVRSRAFYHVGYNVRDAPLSNARFRRVVARLLDRSHLVESVFDGYARAATNPLAETGWFVPDESDDSPASFLGSDGDLDVDAALSAFVEAGYRYDDGRLLSE